MTEIISKNNQTYKLFQKLETKKYREKTGLYLIEGENLMEEALNNKAVIETVIIRKGEEHRFQPMIDTLTKDSDAQILTAESALFENMVQTETSQGIIAAVRKPVCSPEHFIANKVSGNFVVLDRLQDPGNIGTIIRTADAAGYKAVVVIKGTADVFSPKVVRSATGSLFRIPVIFFETEEETVRFIKAAGKRLVATTLTGSRNYYEEDLRDDIALIIGNEGNGISDTLIEKSDLKIKIPMEGTIESLNASVAAAIIMYEAVRARGARKNI